MPGNKNSGRKKKIVTEEQAPIIPKKKVGRPKKGLESKSLNEEDEPQCDAASSQSSSGSLSHDSRQAEHETLKVRDLKKRTSDTSIFYDSYLGSSLDKFPASKLPLQRVVLQRYRSFLENDTKITRNDITTTMTKEIVRLWEFGYIPMKNYRGCWDVVKTCINTWVNAKNEVRKSITFQSQLDTLLDLRPASYCSLSSLKDHLKNSGNAEWNIDYDFFKGQLKHPQTTSISSTKDDLVRKKVKEKEQKQTKALLHARKNKGDFSDSSAPECKVASSSKEVSEDNILLKSPRQCTSKEKIELSTASSTSREESSSDENDEEWNLPLRFERKLTRKPETLTLTLPSKKIPALLASTSTVIKTSVRNELKLVSTILTAGGADINDASCSVSTIYRQRKAAVGSRATEIRKKIKDFKGIKDRDNGCFLVLHWDGKIIQLLSGHTEDRLAIAISSPNCIAGQFVASPAIPDGTGLTMANCVYQKVSEFELLDDVEAVVFDTTASNTGKWSGSVTRFETMLNRALLWLACRHHIPELHIKHASTVIRGPSKGPDDSLFKDFKKQFQSLDLGDQSLWKWPDNVHDWRHQKANEVLLWAAYHMQHATWPREDYRELLELVVTYLGGVVKRVQNGKVVTMAATIRKPGAIHRARFMASCLYLLKICLYQTQFDTSTKNLQDTQILGEYITLLHAPYFLKTPLATSAPRHDRDFWVDICAYKNCFDINSNQQLMIEAVQESVKKHLWYLTAELVVFALFDDGLGGYERKAIATKLLSCPRPNMFTPGKPSFPTHLMVGVPSLDSFVNERSWLLFHILAADGEWLRDDVPEWENSNQYSGMKNCLHDLKVVNDVAERCIKDIQEYADVANDSQYREDILIVATDHRGIFQDLRKQALQ